MPSMNTPPAAVPGAGLPAAAPIHAQAQAPGAAPGMRVASTLPDSMVPGGLPSRFNGSLIFMQYAARKYSEKAKGKENKYYLCAEICVRPDDPALAGDNHLLAADGSKIPVVRELLRVDDLNQWVPSLDGVNPAGVDLASYLVMHNGAQVPDDVLARCAGPFLIPGAQNSRAGTLRGTKWNQWCKALQDAKYPLHKFVADLRLFGIGVYGHWVRMPFEPPTGMRARTPDLGGDSGQQSDTLVILEILRDDSMPAAGTAPVSPPPNPASTAPVSVSAPSTAAPVGHPATADITARIAAGASDLGPALEDFILSRLAAQQTQAQAAGQAPAGLTASGLMNDVYQHFQANGGLGAQAIVKLNDTKWLLDGDNRKYWVIPHKGLLALTQEDAQRLSA